MSLRQAQATPLKGSLAIQSSILGELQDSKRHCLKRTIVDGTRERERERERERGGEEREGDMERERSTQWIHSGKEYYMATMSLAFSESELPFKCPWLLGNQNFCL